MSWTSARRFAGPLLLWAAPLGVGLALILLLASAPLFRAGPETPSAGDSQAWGAMWAALALVATGCAAGGVATLAWLFRAWRRRHRPSAVEWFRTVLNLVLVLGFCWIWFRD